MWGCIQPAINRGFQLFISSYIYWLTRTLIVVRFNNSYIMCWFTEDKSKNNKDFADILPTCNLFIPINKNLNRTRSRSYEAAPLLFIPECSNHWFFFLCYLFLVFLSNPYKYCFGCFIFSWSGVVFFLQWWQGFCLFSFIFF